MVYFLFNIMKKNRLLISLALILFSLTSQAQLIMIDSETGEYNYEEVIETSGITKDQIHSRAKEWINLYYKPTDSIDDNGTDLKFIGTNDFVFKLIKKEISMKIFFNLEIKTKVNKYKYEFSKFEVGKMIKNEIDAMELSVYINRFPEKYQILIEEPIDTEIMNAIGSLQYYIQNGSLENNEDDW